MGRWTHQRNKHVIVYNTRDDIFILYLTDILPSHNTENDTRPFSWIKIHARPDQKMLDPNSIHLSGRQAINSGRKSSTAWVDGSLKPSECDETPNTTHPGYAHENSRWHTTVRPLMTITAKTKETMVETYLDEVREGELYVHVDVDLRGEFLQIGVEMTQCIRY